MAVREIEWNVVKEVHLGLVVGCVPEDDYPLKICQLVEIYDVSTVEWCIHAHVMLLCYVVMKIVICMRFKYCG